MAKYEIKLNNKVIGFYDFEIIAQTPRKVRVFGSYDTRLAPSGGGGDALHSFQSRKKDNFGGRMNDAVQFQLKDFHSKGINPQVESIKIEMPPSDKGPVVNWEVIVGESRDNKAWVGFNSRGAAGPAAGANGSTKRAERQAQQKKRDLPGEVGEKPTDVEFKDILDYRNTSVPIRQIFWTYTRPSQFPPKKGDNQTPSGPQGNQGSQGPQGAQSTQGTQGDMTGGKFDELEPEPTPTSYPDETTDPNAYAPNQDFPPPDPSLTSYDEANIVQITDEEATPYSDELEEVTEQEQSRGDRTGEKVDQKKSLDTKKSIKNIFPNKRKARDIKIQLPAANDYQREFVESFGNLPILWYNTVQIQLQDIISLTLTHQRNIPTIEVTFNDTFGLMKDKGMPLDDSRIAIFINPRTSLLKPIHIDFKIINFSHSGQIHSLVGVIDVPQLYIKRFQTYSNLTSYKLYEKIAQDTELGFNTNLDDTDDKMVWLNPGDKIHDYMNSITKHTYKSDETYLVQFIDYYYNLNYIDVEKEMSRDIAEELGVANIGIEDVAKIEPQETLQKNYLTNAGGLENSNIYYKSYTLINNSTKLSLLKGYLTKIKFYDQKNKSLLVFDVDAITGPVDDKILLRGAQQDDSFFKENIDTLYAGKLDTDNVHKNYYYATIQNRINYLELSKIQMIVEMKTPNYNFYMYQKIFCHVSETGPTPTRAEWNQRLSGQWLITDIAYKFIEGTFTQVIQLNKRDLELSPEEKKNQTFKKKSSEGSGSSTDRGSNSNPIDKESPLPPQQEGTGPPEPAPKPPTSKAAFPKGNILEIMKACTRHGITNVFSRKALLGVASKESPQLKPEISYKNTNNARIRQIFGKRVRGVSDAELDRIKQTDDFWELVYGRNAFPLASPNPGDGKKYKGRGFNQITFRSNYEALQREYVKQGSKLGPVNIVDRPEGLGEARIAAEFYILFMIKSFKNKNVPINNFTDLKTAVYNFTRANAGWGPPRGIVWEQGYGKAYAFASKLTDADVKDSPAV
jgi:predicted chitinase